MYIYVHRNSYFLTLIDRIKLGKLQNDLFNWFAIWQNNYSYLECLLLLSCPRRIPSSWPACVEWRAWSFPRGHAAAHSLCCSQSPQTVAGGSGTAGLPELQDSTPRSQTWACCHPGWSCCHLQSTHNYDKTYYDFYYGFAVSFNPMDKLRQISYDFFYGIVVIIGLESRELIYG